MLNWFYCHTIILWFKFVNYIKEPSKFNLLDGSLIILFLIDLYLVYLYGINFNFNFRVLFICTILIRMSSIYKFYNFKGNMLIIISSILFICQIIVYYNFNNNPKEIYNLKSQLINYLRYLELILAITLGCLISTKHYKYKSKNNK